MNSIIVISIVIGVCAATCNENDLRVIDSLHPEAPCSSQGGMCTIASDCPPGLLTKKQGLCPSQKSKGVECCNGISVKETRCVRRGGECFQNKEGMMPCAQQLIIPRDKATDCPKDTTCCVLVN